MGHVRMSMKDIVAIIPAREGGSFAAVLGISRLIITAVPFTATQGHARHVPHPGPIVHKYILLQTSAYVVESCCVVPTLPLVFNLCAHPFGNPTQPSGQRQLKLAPSKSRLDTTATLPPRPYTSLLFDETSSPNNDRYPLAQLQKHQQPTPDLSTAATSPSDNHHPRQAAPAAAPTTTKIASYSKGHRTRTSLLGGGSAEGHYQPLSGASSFSAPAPPPQASYSPGGYHDRQGLAQDTVGGLKTGKMYVPKTLWTRAFMGIAVAQAIIALGLEGYVFGEFQSSLKDAAFDNEEERRIWKSIPTYLAIFIFGFLYQLLLVWDALRLKNTIQVIGLCLYNLGMMTYSGVQMEQVDEVVTELGTLYIEIDTWGYLRPVLVAVPCVLALGTALLSFVAWKLYGEFAWTIYKHISADLRLKRRFLTYQIYIALLKFDFFFFLGFAVQFLVIVPRNDLSETVLTIAALPIIIGLLILAAVFVRRESVLGHSFIIALDLAAMAYFIFKLFRMWDSERTDDYKQGRSMLTTFAVFAILLLLTTIGVAVVVMMNFNKGLAPHIQTRKVPEAGEAGKYGGGYMPDDYSPGQSHQLGAVPNNRMTID